jgi:hypothetical protein
MFEYQLVERQQRFLTPATTLCHVILFRIVDAQR